MTMNGLIMPVFSVNKSKVRGSASVAVLAPIAFGLVKVVWDLIWRTGE